MRLQPVATSLFTSHSKEATRNCSPVVISCGPVQLPVRVKSCNWTLKHYLCFRLPKLQHQTQKKGLETYGYFWVPA